MAVMVLLLASLLAIPAASSAEELVLGLETETGWTGNVSFSGTDEEDAFSYRMSPHLQLGGDRSDLQYELRYHVSYEDFFNRSDADTIDQVLGLGGSYHVSDATQITFNERFAREQSLTQRFESVETDPGESEVPDLENRRRRFVRNSANVGLNHRMSRRWAISGSFGHNLLDFRDDEFVDSSSFSGTGTLSYVLSERDRVGVGLGTTHQDFDEVPGRPGSQTLYHRVFGSWDHSFSRTLSMALQAGPTWIRSESDGPAGSDSRFTYFGEASLAKRWEAVTTSLHYSRSESTSSGASGGTVADAVSGRVRWAPSPRWSFGLSASWTRQQSAADQIALEAVELPSPPFPPGSFTLIPRQIDTDDSVDQWNLTINVQHRLSRQLSAIGRFSWVRQERDVDSFASSSQETDRLRLFVGLQWQTKPFRF